MAISGFFYILLAELMITGTPREGRGQTLTGKPQSFEKKIENKLNLGPVVCSNLSLTLSDTYTWVYPCA